MQVNSDRQQQEANQEKNEQNVQSMEQQQRMSAASPMSGSSPQQSSPSPVTQQAVTNQVAPPMPPLAITVSAIELHVLPCSRNRTTVVIVVTESMDSQLEVCQSTMACSPNHTYLGIPLVSTYRC